MIEAFIDILRDWKRILFHQSGRDPSTISLLACHLKILAMKLLHLNRKQINVLGFDVVFFDALNLLHLYREIFISEIYDCSLDSDEPVIVDCGSNIGMSILFFKKRYPNAKIIGFEPHPDIHNKLEANMENNNLKHVEIHKCALGSSDGSITFYENPQDPGALNMGTTSRSTRQHEIKVPCKRLSEFLPSQVDLLKMDIEGAETMVLQELSSREKLRNVANLILEYHHHLDASEPDGLSIILSLLENAGFGYQLDARSDPRGEWSNYQDVLIYAYRKPDLTIDL